MLACSSSPHALQKPLAGLIIEELAKLTVKTCDKESIQEINEILSLFCIYLKIPSIWHIFHAYCVLTTLDLVSFVDQCRCVENGYLAEVFLAAFNALSKHNSA